MNFSKMVIIALLATVSQFALAVDCYELGAQAELSVHINASTKKGMLNIGEEIKFNAKKQNAEGTLATFTFKAAGKNYSLSILNEPVSSDDKRNSGILTDLNSSEKVFLGCSL